MSDSDSDSDSDTGHVDPNDHSYTLMRNAKVRRNNARLTSLGLNKEAELEEALFKLRQGLAEAKAKRIARKSIVRAGEERRSKRVKKINCKHVMLSYDDDPHNQASPQAVNQFTRCADIATLNTKPSSTNRRSPSFPNTGRVDLTFAQKDIDRLTNMLMDSDDLLQNIEKFLVSPHHPISPDNARKVICQLTKLLTGQGVRYESRQYGWKLEHQIFQKGVPMTLLSDVTQLMKLAIEAENQWGHDHSNGWLLRHPLKKFFLFQQFCLQNPNFLSQDCRLKHKDQDVEEEGAEDVSTDINGDSEEAKEATAGDTRANKNDEKSSNSPDKEPSPQDHVGSRVAKEFGDKVFVGTVQKYDVGTNYWFVVYDDGDGEDMASKELQQALQLLHDRSESVAKQPPKKICRPRKKRKHTLN